MMPGIQPPDTSIEALTARLGDYAKPDRELALSRLEKLGDLILGDPGMSPTRALATLNLSWRTMHEWRTRHPDLWEAFHVIRDTYADSLADSSDSVVDEGLEYIKKLADPKLANAVASMWRERIRTRQWLAERSSARWAPKTETTVKAQHQVIVLLPPLAPLPGPSVTAAMGSGTTPLALHEGQGDVTIRQRADDTVDADFTVQSE